MATLLTAEFAKVLLPKARECWQKVDHQLARAEKETQEEAEQAEV